LKIAIIEDDINMRKSLETALGDYDEFVLVSFKNAVDALKTIDNSFDLIITDINMPKMDGIEFLKKLGGKYEAIVITGNATLNRAIESLRLGVKDFLLKPFDIETLVKAIKRSTIVKNKKIEKKIKPNSSSFYGTSKSLDKALNIAKKASASNASILLLGDSGVGKELFANYIHKTSKRADKPFIAINMAAIPANLIESELFGYEKGAFTDATSPREGKFELSSGGTIFLDEISEMPFSLQAKLLRVLQEKEVTRLGGSKPISVDLRVISATNSNLKEKISSAEFREDLYYRLNTIPIKIPPLRDRKNEILDIANRVLENTLLEYNLEEKKFSDEAKQELFNYNWPGNIRELISVIERSTILSEGDVITKDDLFLDSRETKVDNINAIEKNLIIEVLNSCNNDIDEATKILGMTKSSLQKKIADHRL
jgi:DNA-binding NtrC family response regulator